MISNPPFKFPDSYTLAHRNIFLGLKTRRYGWVGFDLNIISPHQGFMINNMDLHAALKATPAKTQPKLLKELAKYNFFNDGY